MKISERQYHELVGAVVHEGDPQLAVGPLTILPPDLPPGWAKALTAADPAAAILELWEPVADRVPRIRRALEQRLQGVGLLTTDRAPASLIYFFGDDGECVPLRGRPPLTAGTLAGIGVPGEFSDFYLIHDGWVHHYSEDAGPMPHARWVRLDALWADVVWQVPPGDVSPATSLAVYIDSDELAFAYETGIGLPLPLRCSPDGGLDVLLDMWAAIDREMGAFLEQLDPVRRGPSTRRAAAGPAPSPGERAQALIDQFVERRTAAAQFGGGSAYALASDLLLGRVAHERESGGQRASLVEGYQEALRQWSTGVDHGAEVTAAEALDWFGVAHALGDPAAAHFIATLPATIWADDSIETVQARALFCLYLGDEEQARDFVQELLGLTFDGDEPPGTEEEITARMLEALAVTNAAGFAESRQRAIDELTKGRGQQQARLPWKLRLSGFDAVAVQLGIVKKQEGRR